MPKDADEMRYVLDEAIPYRLDSVTGLSHAWGLRTRLEAAGRGTFVIADGDQKLLTGTAAAALNAWMELGLVHGRALLEFLGIGTRGGGLTQRVNRQDGDWGIEDFGLPKLDRDTVLRSYNGPHEDAEAALVCIMVGANKIVAHLTADAPIGVYADYHLDIACRGIVALVKTYLYRPLGLPPPPSRWANAQPPAA